MSVLHLDDPDAIRRPTPKLDRAWVIGLSLTALGGFASGFIQQTIGPLGMQAPVEAAPPTPVADIQPPPQAPPPAVKPAMQVAAAEPEAPKLQVPDPVAAVVPDPVAATPPVDAAPAPAASEPVAPVPTEAAAEVEEPPTP
jgi:hypothetical protein